MTLFAYKEKMAAVAAQLAEDCNWIAEKAANPETPMADIEEKKKHRDELQARFDLLKEQHDALEKKEMSQIQQKAQVDSNPEQAKKNAKGEFYRAVLLDKDPSANVKDYSHLGAIPALDADLGYGSKLLPTNMTNELIVEPAVENPMRAIVRVSNITGLEEPKLLFDLDGAYDSITDKETAKEVEMEGDTVSYGRNKVKVKAKISDTVLHGSTLNLTAEVESALKSGLAANEMSRMFTATPAAGYEHMSFYSTENAVKSLSGASKQAAIGLALADLPLAYRRNARIIMSSIDWFEMWSANLNQSGTFYEDRPLQLFGKQVVLVDDAVDPIVGDFQYARINYDIAATYDVDKDVDAGIYKFVLTAWYDMKLRMKAAFRIAKITP